MISRRDMLLGGTMVAALGLGEWFHPRRELRLLPGNDLSGLVPPEFGGWEAVGNGDFVLPKTEGTLNATLYSDLFSRVYRNKAGDSIMLLIAYGGSQSDLLQLHRPESCYPAVGFRLDSQAAINLPIGAARLPAVALTARRERRTEDIVYWSRLAEYLPQTAGAQREARFRTALDGVVGDGILVRASIVRQAQDAPRHAVLEQFLASLVVAVPRMARPGLVGTRLANRIG